MTIVSNSKLHVGPSQAAQSPDWRTIMAESVRDLDQLRRRLGLPADHSPETASASSQFSLFVPPGYLARIRPRDPLDPLLRQVLPTPDEVQHADGFVPDPLGEKNAARHPGLLQKYAGRALFVSTGVCAVHCRYCFRRHFPYAAESISRRQLEPALGLLAQDPTIHEAILSGGDPLTLDDNYLEELIGRLASIRHLRRLRIHTRLPVMIPERITSQFLRMLRDSRLTAIIVIHANHPAEIDQSVANAMTSIVDASILVFNQAVLLRGVNDDVDVLERLCLRLIELGVVPYYLHQLDRVAGASHFEVPEEQGKRLVEGLRKRLPGYAMPRYVREVARMEYKLPL